MKRTAQIFLCYARQDEAQVKAIYDKLELADFDPWMDTVDLVGGEKWAATIQKIIPKSDFFIACLSKNSVNKRGFLQREISVALDALRERLEEDIYIIPLRLEDCDVPESLSHLHWVDYFGEDGWERLINSIKKELPGSKLTSHIKLRSRHLINFSKEDAIKMIKAKDFFEAEWNWKGEGIYHEYDVAKNEEKKLIIDHATSLIWHKTCGENQPDYHDAEKHVASLNKENFAGFNNWRLPTLEEAMSLMVPNRSSISHINQVFGEPYLKIWTSDRQTDKFVWIVDFYRELCKTDPTYFYNMVVVVRKGLI